LNKIYDRVCGIRFIVIFILFNDLAFFLRTLSLNLECSIITMSDLSKNYHL